MLMLSVHLKKGCASVEAKSRLASPEKRRELMKQARVRATEISKSLRETSRVNPENLNKPVTL